MISTASFQQSSSHARQSLRRAPQYSTARIPSPSYPGKKMSAPQRFHPQRNSGEIVLTFSATATAKEEVPLFLRNVVFPAFLLKIGCANASLIQEFSFSALSVHLIRAQVPIIVGLARQYMPNVHHVSVRYIIDDLAQETSI
jgi:hypothetical protein